METQGAMFDVAGLAQRAGGNARKVRVAVVLRPAEHDIITRAAKKAGLSVMSYLRGLALRAAGELGISPAAGAPLDPSMARQLSLLPAGAVQAAEREAAQLVDEVLAKGAEPSRRGERIKPTRKRTAAPKQKKGPKAPRAKEPTPKKPLRRGRK